MKIFDALFGKKKIINHPILGNIESERILGNNQTKIYDWSGNKNFYKNKKTFFTLNGDCTNPDSTELSFIIQFMENLNKKYLNEIIEKIYIKDILKNKSNFKNEYYLSAIISLGKHKFEVIFDKIDENKFNPIGIEYQNGIISKVYEV